MCCFGYSPQTRRFMLETLKTKKLLTKNGEKKLKWKMFVTTKLSLLVLREGNVENLYIYMKRKSMYNVSH